MIVYYLSWSTYVKMYQHINFNKYICTQNSIPLPFMGRVNYTYVSSSLESPIYEEVGDFWYGSSIILLMHLNCHF